MLNSLNTLSGLEKRTNSVPRTATAAWRRPRGNVHQHGGVLTPGVILPRVQGPVRGAEIQGVDGIQRQGALAAHESQLLRGPQFNIVVKDVMDGGIGFRRINAQALGPPVAEKDGSRAQGADLMPASGWAGSFRMLLEPTLSVIVPIPVAVKPPEKVFCPRKTPVREVVDVVLNSSMEGTFPSASATV